jgi:glycosyltransferase involved in cell wall biosynthesis/Tfp pilus assembly protein PilF/SAM-dependent methyltransferase
MASHPIENSVRGTVSVVIPCYNYARFLPDAVHSVIAQVYQDFEIIIVNDGSTDDTREVAENLIAQYSTHPAGAGYNRMRLVNQQNQGLSAARNNGIRESLGKYILPLDADDVIHPMFLAETVKVLDENSTIGFVYTDVEYFGDEHKARMTSKSWVKEYDFKTLCRTNILCYCCLYRRSIWEEVGGYNPNMLWTYEDWDYSISMGEAGWQGHHLARPLFHLRLRSGSKLSNAEVHDADLRAIIVVNHPALYSEKDRRWAYQVLDRLPQESRQVGIIYQGALQRWLRIVERGKRDSHTLLSTAMALAHVGLKEEAEQFLRVVKEEERLDLSPSVFAGEQGGKGVKEKNGQQIADENRIHAKPLCITYLIHNILGVTGGNQTLLRQVNELIERGHQVTIVTQSPHVPDWFPLKASVITVSMDARLKIPPAEMSDVVPPSDVVVSTYFMNTHELLTIEQGVRVYFAQGDQYLFDGWDGSELGQKLREWSDMSYRMPVHLLVNSHATQELLRKRYGREASLLPVAIDHSIFYPQPKTVPQSGTRRRILVVGPDTAGKPSELLYFKGIRDILEALKCLQAKRNDFEVIRVSNSPPDIFKHFPCEFHVHPNAELKKQIFGKADILIYGSHYDSCPLPPLEAMASGIAVVCTDTLGAREYCTDEENCLLIPVKNPDALARAMERLLDDEQLRKRIAAKGIETAKQYTWENQIDLLEKYFYHFLEADAAIAASTAEQDAVHEQACVHSRLQVIARLEGEGRYDEAIEEVKLALAEEPSSAEIYYKYAQILQATEHYDASLMQLQKVVLFNPRHVDAHNDLGVLYFQNGDIERAIEHLKVAVSLDHNWTAYKNLGSVLMELGRYDEALPVYQKILYYVPDDTEAQQIVAQIREEGGEAGVALTETKQTVLSPLAPNQIDSLGTASPAVCNVCGERTNYLNTTPENVRESLWCNRCNSLNRDRWMLYVLSKCFGETGPLAQWKRNKSLRILETDGHRGHPTFLEERYDYHNTYFTTDGVAKDFEKMEFADLQNLHYPDEYFDVVITCDVFEHVRLYEQALREVYRVLRKGGYFILQIPFSYGMANTVTRVRPEGDKDIFLLPPVYHGDNSLVYRDYGKDFLSYLTTLGFTAFYIEGALPQHNVTKQNIILCVKADIVDRHSLLDDAERHSLSIEQYDSIDGKLRAFVESIC